MSLSCPTSQIDGADAVPARLAPFVRAVGPDAAVDLFLRFGGGSIYLSRRPRAGSALSEAVGRDGVGRLAAEFGQGHIKVPMAKGWVARQLDRRGVDRAEIASTLHVTRESVRTYLLPPKGAAA